VVVFRAPAKAKEARDRKDATPEAEDARDAAEAEAEDAKDDAKCVGEKQRPTGDARTSAALFF
jgi:hypothetical protein